MLNKVKTFLVIELVAGIFTAIFPLFVIGVEAQPSVPIEDPEGIAYDPVSKRVYVSNTGDDTVYVINL